MFFGDQVEISFARKARAGAAWCSCAGFQGAAGARSGGTQCTACFGKGISCSNLELKLQDPLPSSVLLDTGTCLQLAVPIADATPISQGALGSKGHTPE